MIRQKIRNLGANFPLKLQRSVAALPSSHPPPAVLSPQLRPTPPGAQMEDWAPVVIGIILFVVFSPGFIFQLPGHEQGLEFGSFKTNGKAVAVHAFLFSAVFMVLILGFGVHIYSG
ncbi:hypothetical protein EJ110_NYTH28121 [Nymphaea thermarum]|nr:hypothetical protein EJ110_NYTH28121 [Nymphaea thermarum]